MFRMHPQNKKPPEGGFLRAVTGTAKLDYLLSDSLAAVTAAEAAAPAAVAASLAASAAPVTAAEAASPTAVAAAEPALAAASTACEAASAALLAAEAAASAAEAAESAAGVVGSAGVSVLLQPTMAIEANRANRSDLFISQFLLLVQIRCDQASQRGPHIGPACLAAFDYRDCPSQHERPVFRKRNKQLQTQHIDWETGPAALLQVVQLRRQLGPETWVFTADRGKTVRILELERPLRRPHHALRGLAI